MLSLDESRELERAFFSCITSTIILDFPNGMLSSRATILI